MTVETEMPATATPLWFGPPSRPLFGWIHAPADAKACGAVVLCPPVGRDRSGAHSTLRLLAEELAASGFVAVRFDYDGTGDSAGGERDPRRVESWLDSVVHAADLARRCGDLPVSLVGMRLGALLAALAASRVGNVRNLVLWDPYPSGRAFVRHQVALQRVRLDSPPQTERGVELPGYELDAATVRDLSALTMPDLASAAERVLLLERPGAAGSQDLREACLASGGELGTAEGQDQLLDVEFLHQVIPAATVTAIARWLGQEHGPVSVPLHPAVLRRGGEGTLGARFHEHGGTVHERVVELGPARLFGIESECSPLADAPTIVMLNPGSDWHAGPNRLWVTLARRWAAIGFRCVRFDWSGLGDSPTRPGCERHVVRAPEAFDDLDDVVRSVCEHDANGVVLVGLCSGAYQALEHGLSASPRAIYAVNPILHFRPPEVAAGGRLHPRRRLCRVAGPSVDLYRRLPARGLRQALRGPLWRLLQSLDRRASSGSWVDELIEKGVHVLAIGGVDELRPITEALRLGTVAPAPGTSAGTIQIEVEPGLDHGLMVAAQRHRVCDRLTADLVDNFVALRQGARPVRRAAVPSAPLGLPSA